MKAAKHILTIMLALLMIISSTGLTLAAHICKGELKELAFYKQEQSCCAKKAQPSHCAGQSAEQEEKHAGCCENVHFSAEVPETGIKSLRLENIQPDQFNLAFTAAYIVTLLQPENKAENTNYTDYPPPVTVRDIPVLVQSFLL